MQSRPCIWSVIVAVASLSAIAAAIASWHDPQSSAAKALGRAFSVSRRIELRIPEAAYSNLQSRQRGPASARWPELLTAEVEVQRRLRADRASPEWQRLAARADLLRGDYMAAEARLDSLLSNTGRAESVSPERAIAYFERAETEHSPIDYARAYEDLTSHLNERPRDALALFNSAVVLEKLRLYLDARSAWLQYLVLDPSGDWAAEARKRLNGVLQAIEKSSQQPPRQDEDRLIRAEYDQQNTAVAEGLWRGHGDRLLLDLLARPTDRGLLHMLREAHEANVGGDLGRATDLAERARKSLERSGNLAGQRLAGFELLYAMQRGFRPCLPEARALAASLDGQPYPWLFAQALLEEASCATMVADLDLSRRLEVRALKIAQSASFPILAERCSGFRAGTLLDMGFSDDAWVLAERGIDEVWAGTRSPERAYEFYYDLSDAAEAEGYMNTARAFRNQAADIISRTAHKPTEAVVRAKLAAAELACGRLDESRREFDRSAQLFSELPRSSTAEFYRLYSEIALARVKGRSGNWQEAVRMLRDMGPQFADFADQLVGMEYLLAKAEAERQAADLPASDRELSLLLAIIERGMKSMTSGVDRLRWEGARLQAWRLRVQNEIDEGRPDSALVLWHRAQILDPGPATAATRMTYAALPAGIAIWVSSGGVVHFKWAGRNTELVREMAARLLQLCSDPSSDGRLIDGAGRVLYEALIAPVSPWLSPEGKLIISPDGPVAEVPFEALPVPSGGVLADRYAVEVGSGSGADDKPSTSDHAVIAGPPLLRADMVESFPPIPEAMSEARDVAAHFSSSTLLSGSSVTLQALARELPTASVFHFAGHALFTGRQTALPLAATGGESSYLDARQLAPGELSRCRLLVLSACSTGRLSEAALMDPDNLVRAALSAGARHVIASRWNVDSNISARLMHEFYELYAAGVAPADALRAAQTAVRERAETAHPYFWAAFTTFRK